MKDFAGKIAFITGGASGAGFGQAQIFSEAGMKVVIADFRQDHIDEAMAYFKEKGAPVHAIKLDVTNRAGFRRGGRRGGEGFRRRAGSPHPDSRRQRLRAG